MLFFSISSLVASLTLLHPALSSEYPTQPVLSRNFVDSDVFWDDADRKARDFVSHLTTVEKIGLVTGSYTSPNLPCVGTIGSIERLNFEGLCFSDGPAGYARSDGVSVFASGITAAATWDRELMHQRAVAIGEEFRGKGAHVHLGPSSGPMGRHATGGRNWESFGPDPYLAGIAMGVSVLGIQSVGVQACSKHYIGNEQETHRTSTTNEDGDTIEAISSNIDDRTLHELYLWPFANAIKAGTASIMCSYNRVNGNYSCANTDTMAILKQELAFPGYVVSDWYATHDTTSSANAGLDVEMPGNVSVAAGPSFFGNLLLEAVNNHQVSEARLTEMTERIMKPYFLLGQDKDYPAVDPSSGASFLVYQYGHGSALSYAYPQVPARNVRGDHAELIRKMGAAGTVLLKNVNGTLPLKNESEIGVFGNDAAYPTMGSVFLDYGDQIHGFDIGTLDIGGGSGTVRHTNLIAPIDAIQRHVAAYGGRVQTLFDNDMVADGRFRTIYPVPDVCLVFLKAFASEGQDRLSADLDWNATMAVQSTAAMCPNTVVIVHGPGVVTMPWADNENVTAILAAHYPGEETGNSIVDVLWGASEPSGRLPYTIPRSLSDYGVPIVNMTEPVTDPNGWQADFDEGQIIDYRHFESNNIDPLYEFGFGLSYATFDMGSRLTVVIQPGLSALANEENGSAPGGLRDLWSTVASVTVEVMNVGELSGTAVPQLYVAFPQDTTPKGTPIKVLRGFEKIHLRAGDTRKIVFQLQRRDLSYWDTEMRQWTIPKGEFAFMAGFSTKDIKVTASVPVLG